MNKSIKPAADKALNFVGLSTDADFLKFRDSIHKRSDTLQNDIHRYLVAVAYRWSETGDVRPAVSRVNLLLAELPKGIRGNAIREWVSKHLKMAFCEDGEAKGTFIPGMAKAKDLDMPGLTAERWFNLKPEAPYKPMDLAAIIQKTLEAAGKRVDSTIEGDAVPKGLLTALNLAMIDWNNSLVSAEQASVQIASQSGLN